MVDMCREKKTGMAEECRRSDGKRALRGCTECGILLFIGYSCESSIAVVQSRRDHRRNKLFCETVRQERTDRGDSPECDKRSEEEATGVLFH